MAKATTGGTVRRAQQRLRIAMIGSRGIPARYGGVETVVDVVARELVQRGHDVTVFCRRGDYDERPAEVDGVKCVYLWAPLQTGLAALVHSVLATAWALPRRFDVLHYHALGPGLLAAVPRTLTKTRVVQTVHGRDDKRAKWGRFPKLVLGLGARSSASVPHETLVVSHALCEDYLAEFGRRTRFVPNATGPRMDAVPGEALERFGLEAGRYVLAVGRIVPEKAPHELVEAFVDSDLDAKLVIVGGSAGADDYAARMWAIAEGDDRVVFTGGVYGDDLAQLVCGAAVFVTGSHLEGLPTTVIEAGRTATPCLASDIAPHVEILGQDRPGARTFPVGDGTKFVERLRSMLADLGTERKGAVDLAASLEERFSVERAADIHEIAYGLDPEVVIDLRRAQVAEVDGERADGLLDARR